jgi:hypothetical protein
MMPGRRPANARWLPSSAQPAPLPPHPPPPAAGHPAAARAAARAGARALAGRRWPGSRRTTAGHWLSRGRWLGLAGGIAHDVAEDGRLPGWAGGRVLAWQRQGTARCGRILPLPDHVPAIAPPLHCHRPAAVQDCCRTMTTRQWPGNRDCRVLQLTLHYPNMVLRMGGWGGQGAMQWLCDRRAVGCRTRCPTIPGYRHAIAHRAGTGKVNGRVMATPQHYQSLSVTRQIRKTLWGIGVGRVLRHGQVMAWRPLPSHARQPHAMLLGVGGGAARATAGMATPCHCPGKRASEIHHAPRLNNYACQHVSRKWFATPVQKKTTSEARGPNSAPKIRGLPAETGLQSIATTHCHTRPADNERLANQ